MDAFIALFQRRSWQKRKGNVKVERRLRRELQLYSLPMLLRRGKAAKPRCLRGVKDYTKPLGIPYYQSPNAWMRTDIMNKILTDLNHRLVRQKRNILLLLDNAPSHDPVLNDKFRI